MHKEDTLRLWEWEHTLNVETNVVHGGPIEYDGSSIYFKEDEKQAHILDGNAMVRGRILASNPVPKYFESFNFSAEIKGGGTHPNIAVGYSTSNSSIVYRGINGHISKEIWKSNWQYSNPKFWENCYRTKTTLDSEPFGENDTIKCCLTRKIISNRDYTLVCFKKNDIVIGQETLKGKPTMWPVISVGQCEARIRVEMDVKDTSSKDELGMNLYFATFNVKLIFNLKVVSILHFSVFQIHNI